MKIGRGFEEKIFGNLIHPGTDFQILITFLLHCVNNITNECNINQVVFYHILMIMSAYAGTIKKSSASYADPENFS